MSAFAQAPRPPRPSVIDLERLMNQKIRVKFTGGREMVGVLRSHDPVPNMVLDNTTEYLRTKEDPYVLSGESRELGTVIVRGTSIIAIAPEEGMGEIANPFVDQQQD